MINNEIWVYDIETLASCFTYTAINKDTEEIVQYVIHKNRDDRNELFDHLERCKGQVGFNNINFDYIIIHLFLTRAFYSYGTSEELIDSLYSKAQEIIEEQDKDNFYKTIAISQKEWLIPQLDLFKIWHYNNKARKTSLKTLEISMNYPNVMEMEIDHKRTDIKIEEVDHILEYNLNDVLATYEFYKRSRDKIDLRKSIKSKFNIPCLNFSDSKIGEQLVLKLYCDKTNIDFWDVKELRTYRNSISLNDCILPWIKFESKPFQKLLENLKSKIIFETKSAIKESVIYKEFKYDYGTGGIHGCNYSGIYKVRQDRILRDADVGSLYPNLAVTNGFYIKHLGNQFLDIYEGIIKLRINAKKEKDNVLSDGFKLALNSVYGKSNDINSFLYDPKFTMCITLNGQLLLTLLAERLMNNIPDIKVIQINTDGITVDFSKEYEHLYNDICKQWELETKLSLEYVDYEKMWIGDVNNYGALSLDGKIKNKGRFEVDKFVGSEPAYHKDNSFRIIPLSIQEYFVNNIPIEQTILNHLNNTKYLNNENFGIYDFCGRQKFTKESYGETHELAYENGNPINLITKQQRNVRYYISNNGKIFIKRYNKGTSEVINKGYKVNVFNKFEERKDYDINYSFYIKEANKIIESIEPKQMKLF